jgi:hypothetical protein
VDARATVTAAATRAKPGDCDTAESPRCVGRRLGLVVAAMTEHEDALLAALEEHYARWRGWYELGGKNAEIAARWALERTLAVGGRYLTRCVEMGRVPWKPSDAPSDGGDPEDDRG